MKKIGLVVAEFNKEITEKMESVALAHAKELEIEVIKVLHVPGVFDAPFAVKKLLEKKEIQGVAVLGAVIQGQTAHDEVVAFSCAQAVTSLSLEFSKPVSLGVCGPKISKQHAIERIEPYSRRAIEALDKLIGLGD